MHRFTCIELISECELLGNQKEEFLFCDELSKRLEIYDVITVLL